MGRQAARKAAPPRKSAPPGKSASPRNKQPSSERVQKLLSAAGIGSRREVERWIRSGRLKVNDEVPALGAKLTPRDRITLDGRPVRLHTETAKELRVLLFHRSPGESLDLKAATSRAAEHLNLPAEIRDVRFGGDARVRVRLDGVLLRRQPEGVPPDRMQHVVPLHAAVAREDVGSRVPLRMPHVQP